MTAVKILGGIVATVALVLLAGLLAVWLLVNPNNYKGRIAAAVKQSTGRDLTLQGDIKLSVLPWVALELGPASLSNLPGFGDEPFMAFDHAAVRVKLVPLLHGRLQVARVELNGLNLRLRRNAAGEGNWQSAESALSSAAAPAPASSSSHLLASLAGLQVTHGRVSFDEYSLENVALETGAVSEERDVPVSLSFDANRGIAGETLNLTTKFDLTDDPHTDDIRLQALSVSGTLGWAGDGRPLHYDMSVPALKVNLQEQTLSVENFALSVTSAHLTGTLAGTQIKDDLHLAGSLALQSLVLGEFAPRFGLKLPKTRDPKALSSLSAAMNFTYDGKAASFSDLKAKLDDTALTGKIDVALGPAPALTFALNGDRIDLDRYRRLAGEEADPKTSANTAPRGPHESHEPETPLAVQGSLTLAAAQAGGLAFTNLRVHLETQDHVTHLHPLEAQLYGGHYSGDVIYDARTASPRISLDEHLSGVDLTQLAAATKARGRVSGKATLDFQGTAHAGTQDFAKTLNGQFHASVVQGAVNGVDVGYELALAQSLLGSQPATAVKDTGRTSFESFTTSATISNGIAQTHDLSIISPVLKVAGQGSINLPTGGLDLNLTASVMKSASTALDVPLKITGTYSDPTVKPDMESFARGAIKDKLKDVLKRNGLEGLFGH
jgi:AsmA protein